jgi:hypothetical protein
MVCAPRRPKISYQVIHRKFSLRLWSHVKHFKINAKYFVKSQFNFGTNSQILMEYNLEVFYKRYMLSFHKGHEHLRKQFLYIKNAK